MNTGSNPPNICIVDTIGVHSGLQHYDRALAKVLKEAGFEVDLVSNFAPAWAIPDRPPVLRNFYQGGFIQKMGRLSISFLSYLAYVIPRSFRTRQWWIYNSFGLRVIDFLFLVALLPMRKRLILLIHDVFSITSPEGQLIRWWKVRFYRTVPRYVLLHSSAARRMLETAGYKGIFLETPTFPTAALAHGGQAVLGEDIRDAVKRRDCLLLLVFGSLRPSKGLDMALAAIRSMPLDLRQGIHLIVAGRDSSGLLGSPGYEIASDLPVTILDRFVTDEEQAFLFQHCDLLLLPYREIYQSGVIEAAITYRLPFMASNLPTFRNVLSNHPSFGFIYGDGAEDLARHLERFVREPDLLGNTYLDKDLQSHLKSLERGPFIEALRHLADVSKPHID